MDATALRDTVRQTAADFEWLEAHCRARPELARHAGELRLAAALTRNVAGPALNGVKPPPLFVAVVGGAGAGKSTVVNLLLGEATAETNPQAGYTRHPTAFLANDQTWPAHLAFLGPLRRLETTSPANLDEDVYQVKRLTPSPALEPLREFIVWDCPDMTTWAATGYVSRLIETAGLADVIVYVASDERYNDEVPTQFLQSLLKAGKAVMVVLTKMAEANAGPLSDHFRTEVLAKISASGDGRVIPIVTVPQLSTEQRAKPATVPQRVQLLNQLLVLCPSATATRDRTVTNAVKFLDASAASLIDVARIDLAELDAWSAAVVAGQSAFERRYVNEYLAGEPFRRFVQTREDAMRQLELPAAGRWWSVVLQVLRKPYLLLRDYAATLAAKPAPPNLPERAVLDSAMTAWLDALQAEALRRAGMHPLWKQTAQKFDEGLKAEALSKYADAARQFEIQESGELEVAAKSLTEFFKANPATVTLLRFGKAAAELVAVVVVLIYAWPSVLWMIVGVLLAVAAVHQLFEWGLGAAVGAKKNAARGRRETLLAETVTRPLAAWFRDKPLAAASPVERLTQIVQRVPAAVKAIRTALVPAAMP